MRSKIFAFIVLALLLGIWLSLVVPHFFSNGLQRLSAAPVFHDAAA